jgi:hypothetical protein
MWVVALALVDHETNLLQRGPAVLVRAENLDTRVVQRTEQAPPGLSGRAVARVIAIPHGLTREDRICALEELSIRIRDREVACFVGGRLRPALLTGGKHSDDEQHAHAANLHRPMKT